MSRINLQKIVTVVKSPGLFRLKSYNTKGYYLEPLHGGPVRFVANERGKVLALGNIDLALTEGSINLAELFRKMERVHAKVPADTSDKRQVQLFFDQLVPRLDHRQVALSHLVKVVSWYHLIAQGHQIEIINEKDDGLTIL